MPQNIKSVEHLINTLANSNIKGSPKIVANDLLHSGSGSLLLDGVENILSHSNRGKKIVGKYNHIQNKLADIDIKTGNKIYDKLDKFNLGKKVNKAFVHDYDIPTKTDIGLNESLVRLKTPMVSAPFEKVKKAVLPVAGSVYLADKIIGTKNKKEGGDTVKEALLRTELIEKIANKISNIPSTDTTVSNNSCMEKNASTIIAKAAIMLKFAIEDKKQMEEDMFKLASENKMMHEQINNGTKKEKSLSLAKQMNEKGVIIKSDIEKKASEILLMDDDAYELLKTALEKIEIKIEKKGAEDLTFLNENYNIESSKGTKRTLADAIEEI